MKHLLFLLVLLLSSCFEQDRKVLHIPLKFSSALPIMTVEIEGKNHDLILDLGSACEFAFTQTVFNTFTKKEQLGFHTAIALDGEQHVVPQYLLQHIQIQNGAAIHAIAEEDPLIKESHIAGRIGRNILQTHNLLLDFPHSQMFLLKNSKALKCCNYSINDFQKVPFTQTRWGAVFAIETDFGSKHFFINTSAPFTSIRRGIQDTPVTTEKFKLGDVNLGPTDLKTIHITESLEDIDGYLGADFFKRSIVFLDFHTKIAWICPIASSSD